METTCCLGFDFQTCDIRKRAMQLHQSVQAISLFRVFSIITWAIYLLLSSTTYNLWVLAPEELSTRLVLDSKEVASNVDYFRMPTNYLKLHET